MIAGISALDDKYKNRHLIITGNQQIRVKDLLIMINEIFGGELKIEYQQEEELHHYEITPYNYKPQVAKKITPIADELYRYLNFNEIPDFENEGRVISNEDINTLMSI